MNKANDQVKDGINCGTEGERVFTIPFFFEIHKSLTFSKK